MADFFAISYNIALAIFGGTAPLIVTYLIKHKVTLLAPSWVLMIGVLISLISLWLITRRK
ncbi:hypothetical protein [Fangia hongkongensis]|uniref:hypothetical protein n=1 Tax=Fangia hongkongensis TaxID=270495 RepID=UPI0003780AF0|nr:hypothetical protein [Fangia hongkongensis]